LKISEKLCYILFYYFEDFRERIILKSSKPNDQEAKELEQIGREKQDLNIIYFD
jgi:hypothetical protein